MVWPCTRNYTIDRPLFFFFLVLFLDGFLFLLLSFYLYFLRASTPNSGHLIILNSPPLTNFELHLEVVSFWYLSSFQSRP